MNIVRALRGRVDRSALGASAAPLMVTFTLILVSCGAGDPSAAAQTDAPDVSVTTAVGVSVTTQPTEIPSTTGAGVPPPLGLAGSSWNVFDYSQDTGIITNL